ncbi:hypothetical protein [Burkholderia ubonensis]|uniref:hypothetical protein n=1 Tax=Burkholderia ubonensis TaxID=101571 RepID=UPI0010568539|nr:hypothetical protein [Burkholderia ubonensis]
MLRGSASQVLHRIAPRRSSIRGWRGIAASFGHLKKLVQAEAKFNTRRAKGRTQSSRRTNCKAGSGLTGPPGEMFCLPIHDRRKSMFVFQQEKQNEEIFDR